MMEEHKSALGPDNTANPCKPSKNKGMSPETRTIVTVVSIAVLIFGFYVWGFTKDGVPSWSLWLVAAFIMFFTFLTLGSLLPSAEEKLFRRLTKEGTGRPAVGVVSEMRRQGSLETTTHRYSYVKLIIDMEADGQTRPVALKVKIEDGLLSGFATGKRIHLLYDPQDSSSVAIDRAQNPISIQ